VSANRLLAKATANIDGASTKRTQGSYKNNVVWAIQSCKLWDVAMEKLKASSKKSDKQFDKNIETDRRWAARQQCAKRIELNPDWTRRKDAQMKPLALPLEIEQMNAPMLAQQGCFIFPLDAEKSFEKNLYGTFGMDVPDKYPSREDVRVFSAEKFNGNAPPVMRILLPRPKKRGYEMLEDMNITGASLFPDLHGVGLSTYKHVWEMPSRGGSPEKPTG